MFIRKILAAGLAVVGVVMVSAAGPLTANNAVTPGATTQGEMSVTYTVEAEASMVVTSRNATKNELFQDITNANFANLGNIHVKTNYPYWDVTVSALNGLALAAPGDGGCDPVFDILGNQTGCTPHTGAKLFYGTTPNDSVLLDVQIGIVGGSGFVSVGTGTEKSRASFMPAIRTVGSNVAVSFAEVLGGAITSGGAYNGQAGTAASVGIKEAGFQKQADPSAGVYFAVSGRLVKVDGTTALTEADIKGQNKNGDYTETLTFTLEAGF